MKTIVTSAIKMLTFTTVIFMGFIYAALKGFSDGRLDKRAAHEILVQKQMVQEAKSTASL